MNAFQIGKGDEVIIQPFTCLAVPEVIIWAGAIPRYVDVDKTLNINPMLLEQSISKKTKAIIVQHTFGIPAQMDLISKITQKHGLILIEDCAHALGTSYRGKKVGTFGDASFFSFGRDKVISSVFGGLAAINNSASAEVKKRLTLFHQKLNYPSYFWILQQILHPVMFFFILPTYNIVIGKVLLVFLQKIHILSFPILNEEKQGKKPEIFPLRYPNGLAILLLNQLSKLIHFNNHRKNIANIYFKKLANNKNIILPANIDGSIFLRFNIFINNAEAVRLKAKKMGFLLGNWYHSIIDPEGSTKLVGYQPKNKFAEESASKSLNLPTNVGISPKDADNIVYFLNNI